MIEIRTVQMSDAAFWRRLDPHISAKEFERKARDGRGYVLLEDGVPAALMRYNLFWDNTPFCTLATACSHDVHAGGRDGAALLSQAGLSRCGRPAARCTGL